MVASDSNRANSFGKLDDQRGESESRQTIRAEDGKATRWPLGRTASSKLREGFGFKRSMSTQHV